MLKLGELFETSGTEITGGDEYLWECFGRDSRWLDFAHNLSVVFDSKDQRVYSIEFYNADEDVYSRWLDPEYAQAYYDETENRGVKEDSDVEYLSNFLDVLMEYRTYKVAVAPV
jgi:hypothetical protein